MSGIAGFFHRDGREASRDRLARMTLAIADRGPDAEGEWVDRHIALGGRTLRSTPESRYESFPLMNRRGDLVLTADARIDNRRELIAMLELSTLYGEVSDGEIILAAYERWGERCPEKLCGDFAFAIWNARTETLFCARDQIGVRPLYYHSSERLFAFASELKGLLQLPDVPREINELRVAEYLTPLLDDRETTFYREIFRLPAAHAMIVRRDRIMTWCYWSLDPRSEFRLRSDEEYADAFRELFTEAVRCRLRSSSPAGAFLSGGLDSSSIASVAGDILTRQGEGKLDTFSALFPDVPQCDESRYINAVLSGGRMNPHFLQADRLSPLHDIESMIARQDEPFFSPNLFIHHELFGMAERQGIGVMLDGFDGDTVVSHGIMFLTELARAGRWREFWNEAEGFSRNFGLSPARVLWRRGIRPLLPEPLHQAARLLRRNDRSSGERGMIAPDFFRRINFGEHIEAMNGERGRGAQTSREDHARRLGSGLIPLTLEVLDHAASGYSIEPRYPFFDRRLVEFSLSLPSEQKIRNGWTRSILRRALEGILPDEIVRRGGKTTPAASFSRGLATFGRQRLDDLLFDDPTLLEPYVSMGALRSSYGRFMVRRSPAEALDLWRVATLASWLRQKKRFDADQGSCHEASIGLRAHAPMYDLV
jgi:asparagine synthase (glutamine-hydrolysing)